MIDMALPAGAKSLPFDYTIEVEDREFKVHKEVMASFSDYFRAMLGASMKESKTDRVELKEVSAEVVSTIIELIYTGDETLIDKDTSELLKCAVYLQIQPVIAACKQKLIADIDEENCLETLTLFMTLGIQDDANTIRSYMKTKWLSNCKLEQEPYEVLQIVITMWRKSEMELFLVVKNWIDVDVEKRKQYLNELMGQVRFSLMTRKELSRVKQYFIYKNSTGAWKALVDKASTYHDLPIHLKVLDESEQTTVRGDPTPVMFTSYLDGQNMMRVKHPRTMYSLDEDYQWIAHVNEEKEAPHFENKIALSIVVNNFLIICPSTWDKEYKWHVFNPRTKSWSVMPHMSNSKFNFVLVHHDKHLYALGRTDVELYSFESNSWSFGAKMPVDVQHHRACVLGNAIYMSGGQKDIRLTSNGDRYRSSAKSTRFERLDISSQTWKDLPPMLHGKADHHMYAMKIHNKDAIVVSDSSDEGNPVLVYDLVSNQWSQYQCISPAFMEAFFGYDGTVRMSIRGIMTKTIFTYAKGNKVSSVHFKSKKSMGVISRVWDIPESGEKPTEVTFGPLPLHKEYVHGDGKLFGGLLSMLPSTERLKYFYEFLEDV